MWKRVAGGLAVAAIAAVGIGYATRPDPQKLYEELIAELRARGEPVTLAEMDAPMPSADRNGAVDLDAASRWWVAFERADDWAISTAGGWNPDLRDPWQENATQEQLAALDRFLVELGPLFAHLDRAAEKPEIVWRRKEIEGARSAFVMSSPISTIQEFVRFLEARALRGATEEERLRGVRAQLAIGARFRPRTLIDALVGCVVHAAGAMQLRDLLEAERIDPATARAALDELLAESFDARFPQMVRGERAHALEMLPFWIDGSMDDGMSTPNALERAATNVGRAFDGREPIEVPTAAERVGFVRELDRYLGPSRSALDVCSEERPLTGLRNDIASVLPRVRLRLLRTDCVARLARLALAAYAHRAAHGDWPAAASGLAPFFPAGVPVDPFTEEDFVLERDGEHLLLRGRPWGWSIESDVAQELRNVGHVWRLPPR